ncbi:MAG: hypothetical protein HPY76_02295 [Anaerolineae bacterium]|jgi:hypothetical protein|nr:hypothetical protein [Anaerolineae bacterium]
MNIGMLWFDNDPKTDLSTKVAQAVAYYRKKYGHTPDICFVHPSMLQEGETKTMGLELKPNRVVRPHHLWLGLRNPTDYSTQQSA